MYNIDTERDGYIHFNDYDEVITHLLHKVNALSHRVNAIKPLEENNYTVNNYTNNYRTNNIFLNRKFRVIHDNNYFTDDTNESYSVCQSIAENEDYIYTFRCGDGVQNGGDDAVYINKYSKATCQNVLGVLISNGGKASGATYNKITDRLYFTAGRFDDFNGGAATDIVFELDPHNLNITRTIHTGEFGNTKCIAFDEENNEYIIGNTTHVLYRFDKDFNKLETINVDSWVNAGTETQDIDIFEGNIYAVTSASNTISVFDLQGNFLYSNTTLDADHWVGETQGISHWKNERHLSSTLMSGYRGDERMTQIFNIIEGNGNMPNENGGRHPFSIATPMTLYVEKSNNSEVNPDGSESHPYYEVWEAINDANMCYGKCNIAVGNGNYRQTSIYNSKFLEIYAKDETPNVLFGGFLVGDGSSVILRNCKITSPVRSWMTSRNGNFVESNGRLTLDGCAFTNGSGIPMSVFDGGELTINTSLSLNNGKITVGGGGKLFVQSVADATINRLYEKSHQNGYINRWLCKWGDNTWHDISANTYTVSNKDKFNFVGILAMLGTVEQIYILPNSVASAVLSDGGDNHFTVALEDETLVTSNVTGTCKLKAVYVFD